MYLPIRILILGFLVSRILSAQPVSSRSDISIKQLATVGGTTVRLEKDPVSGNLYLLEYNGNIKRVIFNEDSSSATFETVYSSADHGLNSTLGITFGPDGALYLVGNETNPQDQNFGTGVIKKGIPVNPGSEERTWSTLAQTVEYAYGKAYNHRMSGVIVSTDAAHIYVNSGARTDHGEEREVPGLRETGLTSIILKLPVDGDSIVLQDDREWLRTNGYLMAEGIRNDFDLAYGPNGDLFSVENSGDRDDPEEMNWIREGHHYGFPWNIGGNRTPQQDTPYVPQQDPLLNPGAFGGGNLYATFYNDPNYPHPPEGVTFTSAVLNMGPDADRFRDTATGQIKNASDLGLSISTFTTHRSPDGIVFDNDSLLSGDLSGGAFVISLNNASWLSAPGDDGEDLLHIALTKNGDNYTAQVTRIVSAFRDPLGIEIAGNKLYIAETGLWSRNNNPKLWEVDLPMKGTTGVNENSSLLKTYKLYQNYPNPFNPETIIKYELGSEARVSLKIYDVLGKEKALLVNEFENPGLHQVKFNASALPSGVYFYTLNAGDFSKTMKLLLMK
ncbi:MAG TPA: T9SS type A sorting domain-containing protein [Ignavibacteriaceae bacterium]|nr:T9SS type A sorting domain-containing protein [Ignavibacteriaceae bacterium]